jgi:hypothetical protein
MLEFCVGLPHLTVNFFFFFFLNFFHSHVHTVFCEFLNCGFQLLWYLTNTVPCCVVHFGESFCFPLSLPRRMRRIHPGSKPAQANSLKDWWSDSSDRIPA